MSYLEFWIGRVMPYVTLIVLIAGLIHRIWRWQKASVANIVVYPHASSNRWEMWRKILGEVALFSTFRKENRSLWSQTWIFHVCLALILLGHTRLITDWPLRVVFGMSQAARDALSAWAGGICGVLAMAACLFLLVRRFTVKRAREVSNAEDFFAMVLLLLILVTGNMMRFFAHFDLAVAQAYFASLFSPGPIEVPSDPLFLAHSFLAQVLLIYLPFGKLLHIPGIFYSKLLLAKDY